MNDERPLAKLIRLQNGDDIVAETVEFEDEHGIMYMLVNPLKVAYVPSEHSGYLQLAFIPWVFPRMVDHQEFMIHADDVLMINDVSEKMNKYYWDNLSLITTRQNEINSVELESNPKEETSISEVLKDLDIKRTYH